MNLEDLDSNEGESKIAKRRRIRKWVIRIILGIIVVVGGIYLSQMVAYSLSHESTDDAFIDGTITPISSEVKGRVIKVYIVDNQLVKAGDPLVEIDSGDYSNIVSEKEGRLSSLQLQTNEIIASIEEKKEH